MACEAYCGVYIGDRSRISQQPARFRSTARTCHPKQAQAMGLIRRRSATGYVGDGGTRTSS
jgi:hypothetical protein